MIYRLSQDSIEMIRRQLDKPNGVTIWNLNRPSDALTLSAAHRLISSLADQTQSRSELEECRDVMAKLERMVEDA